MYPPLQCHAQGWLDVGDGHKIYWEVCGNPMGAPALFVHGGPGAGCAPDDRRWFDPQRYRIVLFDQRGTGRSRPLGEVRANSTAHLLADIEALRRHLAIERWLLFGGSWGATLALAYAQRHPQRVRALVLRGIFTATVREREWLYSPQGAALVHPEAWRRLIAAIPCSQAADPLPALAARLHSGEPAIEEATARAWLRWEHELMELELGEAPEDPRAAVDRHSARPGGAACAAARIGVHYARHDFFLAEGELLREAGRLREVPGIIVQGERDLVTLAVAAQALHRAWPSSRLVPVPAAGHASSHGEMARRLIEATDAFSLHASGEPPVQRSSSSCGDTARETQIMISPACSSSPST
jgi:proline iminopeptidase